jgi:hypothetical protein
VLTRTNDEPKEKSATGLFSSSIPDVKEPIKKKDGLFGDKDAGAGFKLQIQKAADEPKADSSIPKGSGLFENNLQDKKEETTTQVRSHNQVHLIYKQGTWRPVFECNGSECSR